MRHLVFVLALTTILGTYAALYAVARKVDDRETAERRVCKYLAAHQRSFPKQFASCKKGSGS